MYEVHRRMKLILKNIHSLNQTQPLHLTSETRVPTSKTSSTRPYSRMYFVKRSDVTGNRFEWQLGENKVI